MNKEELIKELSKRGITCSNDIASQLIDYTQYILNWNEKVNLTAIKDEETFLEKMVFDSALGLTDLDLSNKKALDIGTGAGFPGVVLYLLNPQMDITLLDSTTKKIKILEDYAMQKGYKYHTISARAEEYTKEHREQFDYVFARAVAPLNILLELALPLLKVGGTFIAMKGPGAEEEIAESQNALKKLNARVGKIVIDILPESKEVRNIVHIIKVKETNKKYPRDYKDIKKLPL